MRKIHFNEETISQIRDYIESGHTIEEAQNRFTLKYDTLRRVMHENNISPYYVDKQTCKLSEDVLEDRAAFICKLFEFTDTPMNSIVKQSKLSYYEVLSILKNNFGEDAINKRKSRMYSKSKQGSNSPWFRTCSEDSVNFKGGIVSDGNGYLMIKKPDWYTGRNRSDYIFYHHLVMCENLGITEMPKGYVVHHIDGNPWNNDISNLAMMTVSAHAKLHQVEKNLCKVQRLSNVGVVADTSISCQTPDNS